MGLSAWQHILQTSDNDTTVFPITALVLLSLSDDVIQVCTECSQDWWTGLATANGFLVYHLDLDVFILFYIE